MNKEQYYICREVLAGAECKDFSELGYNSRQVHNILRDLRKQVDSMYGRYEFLGRFLPPVGYLKPKERITFMRENSDVFSAALDAILYDSPEIDKIPVNIFQDRYETSCSFIAAFNVRQAWRIFYELYIVKKTVILFELKSVAKFHSRTSIGEVFSCNMQEYRAQSLDSRHESE